MAFFHSVGVSAIASLIGPLDRPVQVAAAPCRCQRAVVATYRELAAAGFAAAAVEACHDLYRVHHPEASREQAQHLVTSWLDAPRPVSAPGRYG